MTYRVYSGPRGSQSISPLEKDRHLYKEFGALDEAMSWARHITRAAVSFFSSKVMTGHA